MTSLGAFSSADGGMSFGPRVEISKVRFTKIAGMRADPFPSAAVDADGRIFFAASMDLKPSEVPANSGDTLSKLLADLLSLLKSAAPQ